MKRLAMTNCAASPPNVHGEYYSFDSIKEAFIHCGFTNKVDACPDGNNVTRVSAATFSNSLKLKLICKTYFSLHFLDE